MTDLKWIPSLHHYRGREGHTVDTLVVHYTAGRGNAVATARVFQMRTRHASAHFIVGREGDEVQCVDVDDAAWHAGDDGKSKLPSAAQLRQAELNGGFIPLLAVKPMPRVVNCRSIGIELCNRGWAPRGPNPYIEARHRNPASHENHWESYTDKQLDALVKRVEWLRARFPSLAWVTGHEDVTNADTLGAPGAKLDPGPSFPWRLMTNLGLRRVYYDFPKRGWTIDRGDRTT